MAATAPFATAPDVRVVLGPMGSVIPTDILEEAGVDVEEHIAAAHGEVLDRLADTYGPTLPTVTLAATPDAFLVVRWAEAKICAADILDILRASMDTESEIPERLRRSAWDTLARGLPGLRPGDPTTPGTPPVVVWSGQPAHSSSTPVSNFPNPYGDDVAVDVVTGWSSW